MRGPVTRSQKAEGVEGTMNNRLSPDTWVGEGSGVVGAGSWRSWIAFDVVASWKTRPGKDT